MTPTATAPSWISRVAASRVAPPAPGRGRLRLSPIRGPHSPPPQDPHRSPAASRHLRLLVTQYATVAMRDRLHHADYDKWTYGVSWVSWPDDIRTFVITWRKIFWQLVTSDKCHLSSVGFFCFRQNSYHGNHSHCSSSAKKRKPSTDAHARTRYHTCCPLNTNPHSGSILHDTPHTNASTTNE